MPTVPVMSSRHHKDAIRHVRLDSPNGMSRNYRHYNPLDGRWTGRDRIAEVGGFNIYSFVHGRVFTEWDYLGNDVSIRNTKEASGLHWKICVTKWKPIEGDCCKAKSGQCCNDNKLYEKDGKLCIGFGPKLEIGLFASSGFGSLPGSRYPEGQDNPTPVPPEMKNVNSPNANGIITDNNQGINPDNDKQTYVETGNKPDHLPDIETNCAEDEKILTYFQGQIGQTADYTLFGAKSNCRWYAYYVYNYIINNIINPGRQ